MTPRRVEAAPPLPVDQITQEASPGPRVLRRRTTSRASKARLHCAPARTTAAPMARTTSSSTSARRPTQTKYPQGRRAPEGRSIPRRTTARRSRPTARTRSSSSTRHYPGEVVRQGQGHRPRVGSSVCSRGRGQVHRGPQPDPRRTSPPSKIGRLRLRLRGPRGGAVPNAMRLFVANFPVRKAAEFEARRQCEHLPLGERVDWSSTSPRAW